MADVKKTFSRLVPLTDLVTPAAAVVRALDHPVYDCLYVALAEAEDASLVTADRRLLAAVQGTRWAGWLVQLGSQTDGASNA